MLPRALDVLSMALATGRKCSVVNPLVDADQVLRRPAVVLSASAGAPAFAPEQTLPAVDANAKSFAKSSN